MAQVTLTNVWVHRISDPSERVPLPATAATENTSQGGQVITFAGGFRRAIVTDEHSRTVQYSAPTVDRDTYDTLLAWRGLPIAVRDPLRRIVRGVIFAVNGTETPPTAALPGIKVANVVLAVNETDRDPVTL